MPLWFLNSLESLFFSNQLFLHTPLWSPTSLWESRELEVTLPWGGLVGGLELAVLAGVSSPWIVSPLSSSCCGVTFPCKVCNRNQKGITEVPAYRVVLFVLKDSEL